MFEFCFINCQYARIYLTSALRCHKLWLFLFHFNYFKRNIFVRCLLRYVNSHTNIQRIQSKRHFKQFKNQGMFWHSWKKRNLKKKWKNLLGQVYVFFLTLPVIKFSTGNISTITEWLGIDVREMKILIPLWYQYLKPPWRHELRMSCLR